MSVFKKQEVVKSYPAFDVVRREADSNGCINVTDGEVITDANMLHGWYFGSVVSYALKSNSCPIEAVKRAKDNDHDLHWLSSRFACLLSSPQNLPPHILINDGDVVRFEGQLFTVENAPNKNKKLVPYQPS